MEYDTLDKVHKHMYRMFQVNNYCNSSWSLEVNIEMS